MNIGRVSGILLHITSLPGRFGIGDLGPEATGFVDFLASAGQKLWCLLPLSPTGPENSPYQCRSAFAGNPLLISPQRLEEHGYLSRRDLRSAPQFPSSYVDYPAVRKFKENLLRRAFHSFSKTRDYLQFEQSHSWWLESHAQFMALREVNGGVSWTEFESSKTARPEALLYHKFVQYEFSRQWQELRKYCARRNVAIMGDMPFYLEHNSADVWSNQSLFDLQKNGESKSVGGVPPDYFSKDGQLWGTPTYRWDRMEQTEFQWWINRFRATLEMVDLLRLDHFRGFEAYWKVDAKEKTAKKGRWVKGPGARLFKRLEKELGELPIVAENLGTITPDVEELRQRFGFPGMAVLQFGFDEFGTHRPNNYVREQASFTGTHDNDTTVGWWRSLQRSAHEHRNGDGREILHRAKSYLQTNGEQIHWAFIQAIMTSVANIAVLPLQDILGLGSEARMNLPGRAKGNWRWRYEEKQIQKSTIERLRDLTLVSGRSKNS